MFAGMAISVPCHGRSHTKLHSAKNFDLRVIVTGGRLLLIWNRFRVVMETMTVTAWRMERHEATRAIAPHLAGPGFRRRNDLAAWRLRCPMPGYAPAGIPAPPVRFEEIPWLGISRFALKFPGPGKPAPASNLRQAPRNRSRVLRFPAFEGETTSRPGGFVAQVLAGVPCGSCPLLGNPLAWKVPIGVEIPRTGEIRQAPKLRHATRIRSRNLGFPAFEGETATRPGGLVA